MAEYHALVAGMPVVAVDDAAPKISIAQFRQDYLPQLGSEDRRLVALYLHRYDNRNLLSILRGENAYDDRGCYTREELLQAIGAVKHGYAEERTLVSYMYDFIGAYEHLPHGILPEDALAKHYIDYALQAKNNFVRRWFEFERNVGNIVVALTAREVGIDAANSLIGDDDVTQRIRTSKEQDFGLKTELDYFGNLQSITKYADPVAKERALDELKWRWLDDETFFHYFSIEKIFAFLVKLDIIERWSRLDEGTGQQLFRRLIDDIKGEAQIPDEFK